MCKTKMYLSAVAQVKCSASASGNQFLNNASSGQPLDFFQDPASCPEIRRYEVLSFFVTAALAQIIIDLDNDRESQAGGDLLNRLGSTGLRKENRSRAGYTCFQSVPRGGKLTQREFELLVGRNGNQEPPLQFGAQRGGAHQGALGDRQYAIHFPAAELLEKP